ncbi:hypothetical protein QJS04_geneDACA003087 [Acorus gramineus]|uniref:TPX2 C-terminal domain-containing protein n=1 Tax=Acorus gramineus TaxID=55184 RepID=A0AAV9BS44_ACOGR|nr:hypothetical protein QJS04_geneDACA003087 [Acorus gramineus]
MKEQALVRKLQESAAEERKNRIPIAQGLPLTTEKPQILPKPPLKEKTKPSKIKLHTEQRAARRAGFDDMVAYKMYSQEFLKRYQERLIKMIEEEDIKALRKEMIPKAQLMPLFDEPFFPQRSNRPLTIPREPSFCILDYYRYPQRMYYKYETY